METMRPFELVDEHHIRKLVKKTVETYPRDWIVVYELLQNAVDAVQRSGRTDGRVEIELNLEGESVTVRDNGSGFPHDSRYLGLGGTDKDEPEGQVAYGRQGVGLKAVIYSTESFRLKSTVDGREWTATIQGAHRYLEGEDSVFSIDSCDAPGVPNGTEILCGFPDHLVSQFLGQFEYLYFDPPRIDDSIAPSPEDKLRTAIEFHFRSYTYAGDVSRLLEVPGPTPVKIVVSLVGISSFDRFPSAINTILTDNAPITVAFENKHWDMEEAMNRIPELRRRPSPISETSAPPAGDLHRRGDRFVWICKMNTPEQYASLLNNDRVRPAIDPRDYEDLFEQVSGIYIVVGSPQTAFSKFLFGRPRQLIAASGVPSAHEIKTPARGADATYVTNNIHCIVNLKAQLNYGKQTITNTYLLGRVNQFFRDAVRATLRNIAIAIVGRQSESSTAGDMAATWEAETGIMDRDDLAFGGLSIRKEPADENLVIALFYELVGREYIKDFFTYSLSSALRYDGRFVGRLSNGAYAPPQVDRDLWTLEFKVSLDDLISDFVGGDKNPRDIHLIVVWDREITYHPDYQVISIDESSDVDSHLDRVEYALDCKQDRREIQVIVLKDVVAALAAGGAART
jgi:anti-sigma regulatory factor (Ser/Thr protein kinase)